MNRTPGDKGQRYEVRAIDGTGKEIVVGWCGNEEGKPLSTCIERHPVWHSPKVIDRDTGEIVNGNSSTENLSAHER